MGTAFIRYDHPTGGANWYRSEIGPTTNFGLAATFADLATAQAFIDLHHMCATAFDGVETTVTVTSGTEFVIPDNVYKLNTISCIGGGGSGCAGAAANGRPGGGGGAFAAIVELPVTPGTAEPIQIGQGGVNNTPGNPGTATWFRSNITVNADFGLGGPDSDTLVGVGGLVANCIGTFKNKGGSGAPRNAASGGGGGSSAGIGIDGVDAVSATGALAPVGGGNGGNEGLAGSVPGGGGGGGHGGLSASGDGAAGHIVISYTPGA